MQKKSFHRVTEGNEMCTWGRRKPHGMRNRRGSSSKKWGNNERGRRLAMVVAD